MRENEIDRAERKLSELGRSWTDLATACNTTPQVVSNWKNRGSIPKDRQGPVAAFLQVPVEWLLTGKGSDKRLEYLLPSEYQSDEARRAAELVDSLPDSARKAALDIFEAVLQPLREHFASLDLDQITDVPTLRPPVKRAAKSKAAAKKKKAR